MVSSVAAVPANQAKACLGRRDGVGGGPGEVVGRLAPPWRVARRLQLPRLERVHKGCRAGEGALPPHQSLYNSRAAMLNDLGRQEGGGGGRLFYS